jgi:hypothetical protein
MLRYLLITLLQRSPNLLVTVVGLLLAIVRWPRHPTVSSLTLLALVLYPIKLFVFAAINYWLPSLHDSMQLSYAAISNLYIVIDVLSDVGFAIVLLILVIAAFSERQTEMPAI